MVAPVKSQKELAYLHDLFVAADWDQRFAQLIDDNVELPTEGKVLYVGAGTGGHALAMLERAGEKLSMLGLDENPKNIELARAKASAIKVAAEFRPAALDDLMTADNEFDLVIGNASLVSAQRVSAIVAELVRTDKPNGKVALVLPTASSFGEFFSIYWEALHSSGLIDHEHYVEELITQLPTVSEVEELAEDAGLDEISTWTTPEEFDFETGEAFLSAPLIADFLMSYWLESVPEPSKERVVREVDRIINEERHEAEFAFTVKATLLVGRKARAN